MATGDDASRVRRGQGGTARAVFGASVWTRWALVAALVAAGCSQETDGDGDGHDPDDEATLGGGGATTELGYCDVVVTLQDYCRRCHSDPPQHGAPFPLVTYEQVQPRAARMHHAVESGYMPYRGGAELEPPVESLDEAEKSALLEWLAADAPRGDGECLGDE